MKTLFRYASLLFVSATVTLSSCNKKSDDPTPTPDTPTNPSSPSVCQSDKKTTYILIDASTKAGAADYTKSYSCSVQPNQGTDTIYLDIKAKSDMDYIYITQSVDGGNASPFIGATDLLTDNNKQVKLGSNTTYSYQIAPGINDIPAFKLKIPVNIRNSSSATSDVYNIWMTNGTGSFSQSGKKTVVGPLRIALIYGSITPYISATGINMGDQLATPPSYLTTDGVISTIKGVDLYSGDYTADEKIVAMNSADINLVSIASDGTAYGKTCGNTTGTKPYFIGVGLRKNLGPCLSNTEGTDMTKFAIYSGTKQFSDLIGDDIAKLATPTLDKVEVTEGGVYVFLTADGRLGVIKASGLTKNNLGQLDATVNVDVKVLAVATK